MKTCLTVKEKIDRLKVKLCFEFKLLTMKTTLASISLLISGEKSIL